MPLDNAAIDQIVFRAQEYFSHQVLSWAMAAQIAAAGLALLLASYQDHALVVYARAGAR